MSRLSWILAIVGLIAAVIAVQFDEPSLEIGGAALFVLLFAWVVVALRGHTSAMRSATSHPGRPASPPDPADPRDEP